LIFKSILFVLFSNEKNYFDKNVWESPLLKAADQMYCIGKSSLRNYRDKYSDFLRI